LFTTLLRAEIPVRQGHRHFHLITILHEKIALAKLYSDTNGFESGLHSTCCEVAIEAPAFPVQPQTGDIL
jgi:hypothetical protein